MQGSNAAAEYLHIVPDNKRYDSKQSRIRTLVATVPVHQSLQTVPNLRKDSFCADAQFCVLM